MYENAVSAVKEHVDAEVVDGPKMPKLTVLKNWRVCPSNAPDFGVYIEGEVENDGATVCFCFCVVSLFLIDVQETTKTGLINKRAAPKRIQGVDDKVYILHGTMVCDGACSCVQADVCRRKRMSRLLAKSLNQGFRMM